MDILNKKDRKADPVSSKQVKGFGSGSGSCLAQARFRIRLHLQTNTCFPDMCFKKIKQDNSNNLIFVDIFLEINVKKQMDFSVRLVSDRFFSLEGRIQIRSILDRIRNSLVIPRSIYLPRPLPSLPSIFQYQSYVSRYLIPPSAHG